jgi:hypothetical protein
MSDISQAENTEPRPRPCTCHPDDNPPVPCPQKYALTECRMAAMEGQIERLRHWEDESRACHKLLFEKDAEIERLRAALKLLLVSNRIADDIARRALEDKS